MQSIENYLTAHPFFSGLEDEVVTFLSHCAKDIQIKKGEVLFQQGTHADKFYLLQSGQISVQIPALVGPALELQTLGDEQILGWSWLVPPYRWNFQALALEDSALLEFDGNSIMARCEQDPAFGYQLLKRFAALMSERLDAARQKTMDQWNPPGFA